MNGSAKRTLWFVVAMIGAAAGMEVFTVLTKDKTDQLSNIMRWMACEHPGSVFFAGFLAGHFWPIVNVIKSRG